jgi:hypothetical protein
MTHKPVIYSLNKTQKMFYFPIRVNFFTAWTEQTSIFQYFGNLTFNSFTLYKIISQYYSNLLYLSGILIGTVAWTFLFGAVIMKILRWVATIFQFHLHFSEKKFIMELYFLLLYFV